MNRQHTPQSPRCPQADAIRFRRSIGLRLAAMALGLCAACAPLPRPTAGPDAAAGLAQPELVPIDAILAEADRAGVAEAAIDPVEARLAALRARADQLR